MRQVAHALLTRPPLRLNKIPPKPHQRLISVRLACVRHAASVHPEPGSNSHVKIVSSIPARTKTSFRSVRFTFGVISETVFWFRFILPMQQLLGEVFSSLVITAGLFILKSFSFDDQGLANYFVIPKLLHSQNEI